MNIMWRRKKKNGGRTKGETEEKGCSSSSAATSSSFPEMDPSIWSRQPEDMLLQVLALLPLPSLISLRPTSNRFRTLLSSPSFLYLRPPHRRRDLLLLAHPQFSPSALLPSFCPATFTWRTLQLPARSSLRLLASSSGLLCFSLHPHSPALLITNPLSCASRLLPALAAGPVLSGTILPAASGYRILATTSASIFLYDSPTGSWTEIGGSPDHAAIPDLPGAFLGDTVYFATGEPVRVVGLDLSLRSWRTVEAETPPLAFARVVASGDGLYLVGGVGENGIARGLRVWAMEDGRWLEAGSLPSMMWRQMAAVCFHRYEHLSCLWMEGAVCVGSATWPEVLQWRVGRGTWHWLPVCPLLPEKWSCGFRWFAFAGDLHSLV